MEDEIQIDISARMRLPLYISKKLLRTLTEFRRTGPGVKLG
jgi:hypothetical protein